MFNFCAWLLELLFTLLTELIFTTIYIAICTIRNLLTTELYAVYANEDY
ncbi:MAG: hypothetical protein ACJA1S_001618 [Cellvibrionaceae bacterium]|jgi:hypothetical protein